VSYSEGATLSRNLVLRNLDEDVPGPAFGILVNLLFETVASDLRQKDSPEDPVDTSGCDDSQTDNAVKVVRQRLVLVQLGSWGRNKWCDDEIDVAEEEEDGDWKSGLDRRVPVELLAVSVDPDESDRDEDVDDRKRVGDDVQDEVVGITGGRSQHDDDRHQPVLKETHEGSVEGLVAGPESAER